MWIYNSIYSRKCTMSSNPFPVVTWISMHFQRVVSCFSCLVSTDPYINPEVTFYEKVGVVSRGISVELFPQTEWRNRNQLASSFFYSFLGNAWMSMGGKISRRKRVRIVRPSRQNFQQVSKIIIIHNRLNNFSILVNTFITLTHKYLQFILHFLQH